MRKQLKRFFAFVLALAMIVGYMPMSTVEVQAASKVSVKSLKLNKTQYVLKKGKTVKLKATVSPKKAKVTWTSSNKKVATVSNKGVVKAVASKGTAKITAKSGKKKATCKIVIGTPVKKISASNMELTVGESKKINASVSPKNAKVKTLTYESKNKSVATVNKSGKVTGKKEGTAKILITAKDCTKVKKTIKVKVSAKDETGKVTVTPTVTKVPTATKAPTVTKAPTATPTPKVSMTVTTPDVPLKAGDSYKPELKITSESAKDVEVTWTSSDSNIAAVVGEDGSIQALTSGECTLTAVSKEDANISVSYKVTVGKEVEKTVTTGKELETALASGEATMITLNTEETEINIPEGDYSKVTLVVNAPKAHIVNKGTFKNVLIKGISENTWVETYGNKIFFNSPTGHIRVDAQGNPNVYLLDDTEQITVTNDGNLQELLIASAAKVLVKGDSVASRVSCNVFREGTKIDTYVPLDIYSTTTYKLNVGPGGEQTAVKVDDESSIPQISGIGTLSVTIDSTGENKTIIAENDGSIKDLPTAKLTGHVVTEEAVASNAKVYLVSYSKEVNGENISVYLNGSATKETKTDEDGAYAFDDVSVGNYIIVVEAEGYELTTQNIYIPITYADHTYEMEDIILLSNAGVPGGITGIVYNAETGDVISEGLTVFLRKGMNNITTTEVQKVKTDTEGKYEFKDVIPGQYTLQIRDEREDAVYVSDYYNVSVLSGAVITKNMTISKQLESKELRFVLTWAEKGENVSEDLDIHLYAPYPFEDSEYVIRFGSDSMSHYGYDMDYNSSQMAVLDVDDKEYAGPETITVNTIRTGQYKIFVQDYTNGGAGSSLAASKPQIKVYMGNTLLETLKMPEKTGGVWHACNYDGATGKLTIVNDVYSGKPNETTKAKIGKVLNQLEQFTVIDVAVFAKDQTLIDTVKGDYLKQQDETVLNTYLQQLEELLEKIKKGLTMEKITGNGMDTEFYSDYVSNHYRYSMSGTEETLPELNVIFKDTESVTSHTLEKLKEREYYKLTIKNHTLGVATVYYFYYYQNEEYWVTDIMDNDNPEWKQDRYVAFTETAGLNDDLGRELDIKLMEGITLESVEYKEDLNEKWTYGEEYAAVLHLKKTSTGATKDYLIKYIPLGAELNGITDTQNIILQVNNNYRWDYYYTDVYRVEVFGENKELGTTWKPQVRDGATYTVQYPDEIKEENFNAQARVTVKYGKNAVAVYDIYYHQDTSAAEIVGVRDAGNVYTRYDESSSYLSGGKEYYNLYLEGTNSKLGTDLKVYTRNGATAEIEYATASESFEGYGSDAKITVTAGNGVQRIYYVIYKKSNDDINIRALNSTGNELKKVYVSSNTIYILGTLENLGSDLEFKTNEGYEASYDGENNKVQVKETASGSVKAYNVNYKQDTSCVNLKKVTSKSESGMTCSVYNYMDEVTTTDGKTEKYYRVSLKGNAKECPTDLVAAVEYGNQTEITYAANSENWIYPKEYVAKIVVKDEVFSKTYLATYEQDASQAVVKGITDSDNPYAYTNIEKYESTMYCEDGKRESAYKMYVAGNNKTLGDTYQLELPKGTKIANKLRVGEEGWNYKSEQHFRTYTDPATKQKVQVMFTCVERIVVEAANGAQKVYAIYYGQDESGAIVTGITDTQNTYLDKTEASSDYTYLASKEEADGVSEEKIYMIYVYGENPNLGSTYQLEMSQGAKVTETIRVGEEKWNYQSKKVTRGYYDENDEYSVIEYILSDRVVVEAENGIRRVYVIAYAQNADEAIVTGITDAKNTYLADKTYVSKGSRTLDFKEEVDGVSEENVYMIYVYGENSQLGDTYQLEISEKAKIAETVHVGQEKWNYKATEINRSYHDENGNYLEEAYTLTDRVTVEASNGARRVYVIAYAQDTSGTAVTGIKDDKNVYLEEAKIESYTTHMSFKETKDEVTGEDVYVIYVYGTNKALGNTYQLTIPQGSTIKETVRVGEEGWNYVETTKKRSIYDETLNEYVSRSYTYSDRVVVKAKNDVEQVYVIAYAQDDRGAVVTGITDTENNYSDKTSVSDKSSGIYLKEEKDGIYTEDVYLIYVYGDNAQLGTTYQLTMPEKTKIVETVHVGDEKWNYSTQGVSKDYHDENGKWSSVDYTLTDKVTVEAENGARRVYVIAYAQDVSGTVVSGIADEENTYTKEAKINSSTSYMSFKEEKDGVTSEYVYMIYVCGTNATLGNTYQLTLPEGSTIKETLRPGEEGWNYGKVTTTESWYDSELDDYVSTTYTYSDRVVVKAKNGAEKVYLIAYAQDDSGTVVSGITDAGNTYFETPTISEDKTTLYYKEEVDGVYEEDVYVIYVYGKNGTLGDTYKLAVPEGSTIESTIRAGEEGWNYEWKTIVGSSYDEEGEYILKTYTLSDRVVVKAANGAKRVYVIAYLPDETGLVVNGITDEKNVYSETYVISDKKEELYLNNAVNQTYYEEVNMIYVYGENASLGTTYQLDLPEGSVVESTIRVGEEGWNYSATRKSYGKSDENGNYQSRYYDFSDRVVVKASNGVERVYVIAYAQDVSKGTISKIEDAENIYTFEPHISDTTETLYFSESDGTVSEEEIYMIYVCGANKELGNTYKLTIPEGSVIAETVSVGEEGWKYTKQTISRYQEDMYGANVNIDYKLTDRVVVETPNGATKTYVIVYAQDSYGAIPSALTDENNIFSQEPVITTGTTNLTIHNQDGTYTIDETYVIQVAGGNKELGSTYQLALPEGAEIVSVIHPGDEAWKYKEDKYSVTYENILGVVSREYAYFADLVVIRAANGAERMYAIAYLQDTSGIEAFTVEDTENEGFEVMDFDTTPTEINVTAVDETGAEITKTKEVYVFRVQGSNETLGNTYTLQMPEGTTEISRISNTQEDWKYQDTTVDEYTYESEVTIKATNGAERTYLIAYKQVNN